MSSSTLTSVFGLFEASRTAIEIFDIVTYTIIGAVVATVFLWWFFKKEIRLFRNRRRPIMIFYAKGSALNMGMETKTLRASGFFNIPEDPTDNFQECHRIEDHGLVIVGYSKGMQGLRDILDCVKAKRIPLIVYTKDMLDPADKSLLETYPWYSLCNVPLRLVSDTFIILSTFPIPKHE
jgi:hypothetical protein